MLYAQPLAVSAALVAILSTVEGTREVLPVCRGRGEGNGNILRNIFIFATVSAGTHARVPSTVDRIATRAAETASGGRTPRQARKR
eukprot:scaffold1445_cov100-Isochrysis_galbana.AAC.4